QLPLRAHGHVGAGWLLKAVLNRRPDLTAAASTARAAISERLQMLLVPIDEPRRLVVELGADPSRRTWVLFAKYVPAMRDRIARSS
ncbi:MAG: hypothetical protein LC777_20730, partial [Actinobacteria bacterium]|nr:hypothetical protein [Actinomycetota bacterium]